MRYNHFDMLPEKAFQPVGKRMTLEGGGGLGSVLGTAGSIAAGSNPIGAFGSTLAGQALQGGGGGGSGGGNPNAPLARNTPSIVGNQNQTALTGYYAGMNPASIAYNQMQQQQMQPQVQQPQVQQPQVGATLFNGTVTPNTIGPNGLPVGGMPAPQPNLNDFMGQQRDLGTGGGGGVFSDTNFPRPLPIKSIPPYAQSVFADLARRAGGPQNLFNATPAFDYGRPPRPMPTPMRGMGPQQGLGALMGQLQGGPQNFRGIR